MGLRIKHQFDTSALRKSATLKLSRTALYKCEYYYMYYYHLQMRRGNVFGCICLCVCLCICLSVCNALTFESLNIKSAFLYADRLRLRNMVKFGQVCI